MEKGLRNVGEAVVTDDDDGFCGCDVTEEARGSSMSWEEWNGSGVPTENRIGSGTEGDVRVNPFVFANRSNFLKRVDSILGVVAQRLPDCDACGFLERGEKLGGIGDIRRNSAETGSESSFRVRLTEDERDFDGRVSIVLLLLLFFFLLLRSFALSFRARDRSRGTGGFVRSRWNQSVRR
jgi:hypothetical protein